VCGLWAAKAWGRTQSVGQLGGATSSHFQLPKEPFAHYSPWQGVEENQTIMIVSGMSQQQREIMLIVRERCCEKKMVDLFERVGFSFSLVWAASQRVSSASERANWAQKAPRVEGARRVSV